MRETFSTCERGNVAMMFGLLMFVMIGGAGVAIDFQRAVAVRAELQQAADAALLAAVRISMTNPALTPDQVKAKATDFFEANRQASADAATSNFAIAHDPAANLYRLSFDTDITTTLSRAVGVTMVSSSIETEARIGPPPYMEIALVLDNTGSMNDFGKIGDLKTAATNLVNTLYAQPGADVKFALVPFAQYVNVGADHEGASWLDGASGVGGFDGCVGSRVYPLNTQDVAFIATPVPEVAGEPCPNAILPLTDVQSTITTAINNMNAAGYTYIPAGLAWGWSVLSAAAPFTEGVTDVELEARNGSKTIILMTDGKNTKSPDYPTHDSENIANANQLTDELCDAVKGEDIEIYTIAFAVTDATIKSLLEDCGTTPDHYFEPDTAGELIATFDAIAGRLRNISLSK